MAMLKIIPSKIQESQPYLSPQRQQREESAHFIANDPYDVFLPQQPAKGFFDYLAVRLAIGVAFGVSTAIAVVFFTGAWRSSSPVERPFALFEIQVIGPEGNPVAGATVERGNEKLGVTDSFGEWRRFMQTALGSTVRIEIAKTINGAQYSAEKNIAIPANMPKSGDIEVKERVELRLTREKDSAKEKIEIAKESAKEPEKEAGKEETKDEEEESAAPPVATARSENFASVWISGLTGQPEEAVVKALKARVVQLGLKLDTASPWRLTLRRLSDSLVEIHSSHADDPNHSVYFLRNDKETVVETARSILWAAATLIDVPYTAHRVGQTYKLDSPGQQLWALREGMVLMDNRGFFEVEIAGGTPKVKFGSVPPCGGAASCTLRQAGLDVRPPLIGQEPLQLRVIGVTGARVYVSGFEARKQSGDVYSYWGQVDTEANLAIVSDGNLVHRGKIKGNADVIQKVTVAGPRLAKRY